MVTPTELASVTASVTATGSAVVECRPDAGVVDVALSRDVTFVAARLPLSLEGARSIDVELCTPAGEPHLRVHEAPFDADAGEIIVLCHRHVALATGRLRVVVRDDAGSVRGDFELLSREA